MPAANGRTRRRRLRTEAEAMLAGSRPSALVPPRDEAQRNTYSTSVTGGRLYLAVRGTTGEAALLTLPPREAVALAARLLAGADSLFKDEDMRGRPAS